MWNCLRKNFQAIKVSGSSARSVVRESIFAARSNSARKPSVAPAPVNVITNQSSDLRPQFAGTFVGRRAYYWLELAGINLALLQEDPMRTILLRTMLPAILFIFVLAGCSVTTHDKGNGKNDDVDIKTPFGSLSVKKGASDVKDTGLPPYPGARVAKDDDDNEHHSANVNISSSLF